MMQVVSIIGARPQFIKYFPVSKAMAQTHERSGVFIKDILIHTGQHYDYTLSRVFFDEFGIKAPDYHLEVGSGSHAEQTGLVMQKAEEVLVRENPDAVIVYGDTNSTLGGALAAAKLHIPLIHVEAGLRSYNKHMPEELNRILTDHASTLLLCPSKTAVSNLSKEGFQNVLNGGLLIGHDSLYREANQFTTEINRPAIINVGDVMYDVVLHATDVAHRKSAILEQLKIDTGRYYLLTLHRAENTDIENTFKEIVDFVNKVSSGIKVIFPIHPRTQKMYEKMGNKFEDTVKVIPPVGYFDLLMLLENCGMLMTDSGGMQKEAFWLKTPCITLRNETEWIETIESGWNVLYKNYNNIHNPSDNNESCYGDGKSADRIVSTMINAFTPIN
jgi:UDP-N-acetylglucosamine 2-epimerase